MKNKEYLGIDLVKFICAICILFIHNPLFYSYNSNHFLLSLEFLFNQVLFRMCVPFFFACTGFLLCERNFDDAVFKYIKKIIMLLGVWNCITFSFYSAQLWYLVATVVALLIISIFSRARKMKLCFFVSSILYVFGTFCMKFRDLIVENTSSSFFGVIVNIYENTFATTRNGLFFGLFFIMLGMFISQKKIRLKTKVSIIGFLISVSLLLVEAFFFNELHCSDGYDMYFSLIGTTFFLFNLAKNMDLKNENIYIDLRKISTLIYCDQIIIKKITIGFITNVFRIDNSVVFSISSIVITIVISFYIYYLSKKEKFYFLKCLY